MTYPRCRDCGNDLTSHEEQEAELCWDCMQRYADDEIAYQESNEVRSDDALHWRNS